LWVRPAHHRWPSVELLSRWLAVGLRRGLLEGCVFSDRRCRRGLAPVGLYTSPASWGMDLRTWSGASTPTWAMSGTGPRWSNTALSSTSIGGSAYRGLLLLGNVTAGERRLQTSSPAGPEATAGEAVQRAGDRTRTGDVQLGKRLTPAATSVHRRKSTT